MPQALAEAAARDDSGPRRSLQGVVARIHAGESLRAALGWWVGESGGTEVRLTAAALSLGAEAGGSRARAVEQVASTLRERGAVEAEVRTLSSQVRASVSVLVLAPIAFAGLALSVDPTVGRFLVGSPVGLLCLAGGLLLDAAGAVWMARVTGRPV